ncbi:MAG: hypothetical protein ABSB12_03130 [Candidatus Saccharimonadales bacterium]
MFQNFIILGLIPGTHVQINFTVWLILASMLGLLMMLLPLIQPFTTRFIVRHHINLIALALLFSDRYSV